jgi:hypothetical protein
MSIHLKLSRTIPKRSKTYLMAQLRVQLSISLGRPLAFWLQLPYAARRTASRRTADGWAAGRRRRQSATADAFSHLGRLLNEVRRLAVPFAECEVGGQRSSTDMKRQLNSGPIVGRQ